MEEVFYALDRNDLAKLGIVKLSGWELDHLYPTPEKASNELGPCTTFLCYAAHLRGRDSSVSALLRSGADPTVSSSSSYSEGGRRRSFFNPALRTYLSRTPSCFAVFIVQQVGRFRANAFKAVNHLSNTCQLCGSSAETCLQWTVCQHLLCESCFWARLSLQTNEDDLMCFVCCPGRKFTFSSPPAIAKEESLALYRALPANLHCDENQSSFQSRPIFRGRCLADLASLYIGVTRTQRTTELYKAIATGNRRRIEALYLQGVHLEVCNEYGQTPLFLAVTERQYSVAEMLVAYGANVSVVDHAGSNLATTLSACGDNCKEAADLFDALVSHGMDDSMPGSVGLTAADYRNNLALDTTSDCFPELKCTCLIPFDAAHAGAGSVILDGAFSEEFLCRLRDLWSRLPVAPAEKLSCSDRSYYYDAEKWVASEVSRVLCVAATHLTAPVTVTCRHLMPQMRFLHYGEEGGRLAPHVDLFKTDAKGVKSTHTFILYLSACEGGETALLRSVQEPSSPLAVVAPRPGRLLLFPHLCPHEGRPLIKGPKLLIRGEAY